MKPVHIVIIAKLPQAGFAKTRLIPALGAQVAADLARRMLEHTLAEAIASKLDAIELCVTPSSADPLWQAMSVETNVQWSDQGAGDLGDRMARAAKRILDGGASVLLIGTDCPELDADRLRDAAQALEKNDAVLLPTFDGGYALLGLRHFDPSLFEDIAWSTNTVSQVTLSRMQSLEWQVEVLAPAHDIDEPVDLQWLPTAWMKDSPN